MTLFSGVIAFNTSSSGLKAAHSYGIKTTSFTGKFVILELLVFVFLDRAKSLHALGPGRGRGGFGGGGGLLNHVLYREAPPGGPTL